MSGSSTRQALPIVLVGGQAVAGIIAAEIQSNSFFAADRFTVRAALSPANAACWAGVPLAVEIRIGLNGQAQSLITGNADSVSIDPIRGEIEIAGRDLASLFVGAQIDESFENQTSGEVATALAGRQGLIPSVTPTQTLIGRYYQNGRTRTALTQHARATTQWDLLCWLAQLENYDVWVSGQTLHFQPVQQSAPAISISPQDCMSLRLHHALDIAAGVTVTVKSWDCVSQSAIVQSATSIGAAGQGMTRTVVRPNLSSNEAQMLAARLAGQMADHERRVDIDMPGDLATLPRMTMALTGTGTDFDGPYMIRSVERRISFQHGFTQAIEAGSMPWTAS
jgi:phage protein D